MFWKNEWKPLAVIGGFFLALYYMPVGTHRFDNAIFEALYLTKWYAQEHVLLCLIPAFFIAGAIGVFVRQEAVMKYLGPKANRFLAYGVGSVSGSVLAVCSCTVLPLFSGIYRMGAGLGPATAFLYSGPAINVLPYIFGGLAVALGFRAGLFNIGVEGQIFIGAVTGVWAGYAIPGLPAIIHIPLAMLFGALGGALWGFIPGLLKAKTGAHEVITTIMMNYIAFRLVDWLLKFPMQDPNEFTPKTPWILETAKLPRLFDTPIRFHAGFFIAILMAVAVYYLLFKTTWGFELRMVGSNPNAARYAGVKITRTTILAMVLSGALAGMAGANEVLGVNYRLLPAFSSGYGFDSIALALLGKTHPLGVILSSLLFGFLRNGARSIDIVSILQALILAFIAAPAIIRTIYRLRESKQKEDLVTLRSWKG